LEFWNRAALKSMFLPGGVLLLAMIALLQAHWFHFPLPLVNFCYVAALVAGLFLAWRFHSTRVFFALLSLALAERALNWYVPNGLARAATDVLAILLALNFVVLTWMEERGFIAPAVGTRLSLLCVEAIITSLICRPAHDGVSHVLRFPLLQPHWFDWTVVSQVPLLLFIVALVSLALRALLRPKPVESGFFWSLFALFFSLQFGGLSNTAQVYFATGCFVLVASVVETSYLMAYHDELTGLPGRRAFNETILGLQQRYAIAIVDVDHFKQFNDKYGHDTGDEVLRLVAGRLSQVTGGGKAFRCGGEEFAVVFNEKSAADIFQDLELLRMLIETSTFKVRSTKDRRSAPRGSERRKTMVKKLKLTGGRPELRTAERQVSVTVSIGVAEPTTSDRDVDQVIRTADKALYRAKENGRNRVEIGPAVRKRRRAAQGKS